MLILHLSDIHFREPDCAHLDTDPDHVFRTHLIHHVRAMIERLGKIDAIVIGGDIAFKGDPAEYAVAKTWLLSLAEVCGCPGPERIFVVPGNHDVDRKVICEQPSVRNAQSAIANARRDQKERELRTQFNDAATGKALLLPLNAYNEFAKLFNCQVYTPDHLIWKQDIPITDDLALRIFGLTSILLSGQNGNDDKRDSLYLSPLQTVFAPADDVLKLVVVHHPPDWLTDGDDVDQALRGGAEIHLLGHKHLQRIDQGDGWVRLSAAAVIPGREDRNTVPGYNLIEIEVQKEGKERQVEIRSHMLEWQVDRFRPKKTATDADFTVSHISVPATGNKILYPVVKNLRFLGTARDDTSADREAAMGDEETRSIVYRFWGLSMSHRREIVTRMNLLEDSEWKLPEPERYGRALIRASERNQIDELSREIASKDKT